MDTPVAWTVNGIVLTRITQRKPASLAAAQVTTFQTLKLFEKPMDDVTLLQVWTLIS